MMPKENRQTFSANSYQVVHQPHHPIQQTMWTHPPPPPQIHQNSQVMMPVQQVLVPHQGCFRQQFISYPPRMVMTSAIPPPVQHIGGKAQFFAQPPFQVQVPKSDIQVTTKKQSHAIEIIDPNTLKPINDVKTNSTQNQEEASPPVSTTLNTNCTEFYPERKKRDQVKFQESASNQSEIADTIKKIPEQISSVETPTVASQVIVPSPTVELESSSPPETVAGKYQITINEIPAFRERPRQYSDHQQSIEQRPQQQNYREINSQQRQRGGHSNYNRPYKKNYQVDKQVSTHNYANNSQYHQQNQQTQINCGNGRKYSGNFNQRDYNNNQQTRVNLKNKHSTAKPSSPPPPSQEKEVRILQRPETKAMQEAVALESKDTQQEVKRSIEELETLNEKVCEDEKLSVIKEQIFAPLDESETEVEEESNVPEIEEVANESATEFEETIENSDTNEVSVLTVTKQEKSEIYQAVAPAEVPSFYRYTKDDLYTLQCSTLVRKNTPKKISDLTGSKIKRVEVFRSLFDKEFVNNSHEDFVPYNQQKNHGKQMVKRNSGEMRHSESFHASQSGSRCQGKKSPTNDRSMIKINLASVKLREAENAWKPSQMTVQENLSDKEREVMEMAKSFRLLLNKITVENFEILVEDVKKFRIDSQAKLESVVDILFEKSIAEPGYAEIYAKLCYTISVIQTVSSAPIADSKTNNSLKKILITKCQREFENTEIINQTANKIEEFMENFKEFNLKALTIEDQLKGLDQDDHIKLKREIDDLEDDLDKINEFLDLVADEIVHRKRFTCDGEPNTSCEVDMRKRIATVLKKILKLMDEMEEYQTLIRRRSSGLIKLIGELFKKELLTVKIMQRCINRMLDEGNKINEDNIERLCKLLTTIGEALDKDPKVLNPIFVQLKKLSNNTKAIKTSRIRFEVLNLVELRESKWKVRINQRSAEICPMKLKELEETERKKQAMKDAEQHEYDQKHKHYDNRRFNDNHYRNNNQYNNQQNFNQHGQQNSFNQQHNQLNSYHHNQQNNNNSINNRGGNRNFQNSGRSNNNNYNNRNNHFSKDSEGYMTVNNSGGIDLSKWDFTKSRSQTNEVKLAPTSFGLFSQWSNKNQQQQTQPYESNRYGELANFDDTESLNFRGKNRSGRQNNKQQSPPPSHQNFQIMQRSQSMSCVSVASTQKEVIDKDHFKETVMAMFNGKLTSEQLTVKMRSYTLDAQVICEICRDYIERKEPERQHLMEMIVELCQKKIVTREEIVKGLEELLVIAPGCLFDNPHAYKYIGEYFDELIKLNMLSTDDLNEICKDDEIKEKCLSGLFSATPKLDNANIIDKDEFKANIKAVFNGKLTTEQLHVKIKDYKLDSQVVCDTCCDYYDRKEPERCHLMEMLVDLHNEGFVTKNEIWKGYKEILKSASDLVFDIPYVYAYIGENFDYLMKHKVITLDEVRELCKVESIREKFASIFEPFTAGSPLSSSSPVSSTTCQEVANIQLSDVSSTQSTESLTSSLIGMSGAEDVNQEVSGHDQKVGSFALVKQKLSYFIEKNLKKTSLSFDSIIKIIEDENCKYDKSFVQNLTMTVLKNSLEDKTSKGKDKKSAKKLTPDVVQGKIVKYLSLIKRYINGNIHHQLQCIHTMQAFVYSLGSSPELLKVLFDIFYESEVISSDAFLSWKKNMGNKQDEAIRSTNDFFKKLTSSA